MARMYQRRPTGEYIQLPSACSGTKCSVVVVVVGSVSTKFLVKARQRLKLRLHTNCSLQHPPPDDIVKLFRAVFLSVFWWPPLLLHLQRFGSDWDLLQIPPGGAVSKDEALLPQPSGQVPGVPRPDPPDPGSGLRLPRLLHPPGCGHRRVLLRVAHRPAEGRCHCPGDGAVQAGGCRCLWAAQPDQPGRVRAACPAGGVRCPWTCAPELQLPAALWDAAGLRLTGRGEAFLQRPQHLPAVPTGEPESPEIVQVSPGRSYLSRRSSIHDVVIYIYSCNTPHFFSLSRCSSCCRKQEMRASTPCASYNRSVRWRPMRWIVRRRVPRQRKKMRKLNKSHYELR